MQIARQLVQAGALKGWRCLTRDSRDREEHRQLRDVLARSRLGCGCSPAGRKRVVGAGRRQITRDWFALWAGSFELFVSQLVVGEASGGDQVAAQERVPFLDGIPRLSITNAAGDWR